MFRNRLLAAALLTAFVSSGVDVALAGPVPGSSWVFRQSYYSHQPVQPVQIGRRSAGGPFYTSPQGEYVRSGFRNIRSTINVGGRQYDHVAVWETWVQYGSQY